VVVAVEQLSGAVQPVPVEERGGGRVWAWQGGGGARHQRLTCVLQLRGDDLEASVRGAGRLDEAHGRLEAEPGGGGVSHVLRKWVAIVGIDRVGGEPQCVGITWH
jgi:hypothetical protein